MKRLFVPDVTLCVNLGFFATFPYKDVRLCVMVVGALTV
jgi:hypothetical protein